MKIITRRSRWKLETISNKRFHAKYVVLLEVAVVLTNVLRADEREDNGVEKIACGVG